VLDPVTVNAQGDRDTEREREREREREFCLVFDIGE